MFYKDRLVLVAGGTGFVGTHLVMALLKAGARIRIPVHSRPPKIKHPRIEEVKADLSKYNDCKKVLKDVEFVFHAAGSVGAAGVAPDYQISSITSYLVVSAQLMRASSLGKISRFLLFSSSTIYPVVQFAVPEEPGFTGELHPSYFGYGWMRYYLEKLAEFISRKSEVKFAIARPTAVYGPFDNFSPQTSHVIPSLIRRAVEKENPFVVWGSGEEIRDFLHCSDLARACLLLLEKEPSCKPFNIGCGKGIKIKDLVKKVLAAADHDKAKTVYDNSGPTTISFRVVDTTKARELLGFRQSLTLEKGLRDTVEWYLKNYSENGK